MKLPTDDAFGWYKNWIGPKDFRCFECHMGFTEDDRFVFLDEFGSPHHKECLDPMDFGNLLRRKHIVISYDWRKSRNFAPLSADELDKLLNDEKPV